MLPTRAGLAAGLALWAVALWLAAERAQAVGGVDLRPIYDAGRAVFDEQPIYSVPLFVYPPFAALAFAPLSLLPFGTVLAIWGVLQVALPVAGCALAVVVSGPRQYRVLLTGAATLAVVKADVLVNSLFLFNPTLVFVLPAVAVPMLWHRGRWASGSVVLGLSLAIKPMLGLLFLVPLAARRTRSAAQCFATSGVLTAIGALLSHDLDGLLNLPGRILGGTNLKGELAPLNVSLAGVAEVHDDLAVLAHVLRLVVLAAILAILLRVARGRLAPWQYLAASGGLAVALPVAGSLDEIHYGVLALPGLFAVLVARAAPAARVCAALALLVVTLPLANVGVGPLEEAHAQLRWCGGQLLAICTALLALWLRPPEAIQT